jgi:hypothetical protein
LTQDKKWLKKLNDWHKIKKLLNKDVKRVIKIKWLTMIQLIQITYYVTCWCLWFRETQFKQHAVEVLLVVTIADHLKPLNYWRKPKVLGALPQRWHAFMVFSTQHWRCLQIYEKVFGYHAWPRQVPRMWPCDVKREDRCARARARRAWVGAGRAWDVRWLAW